VADFLTHKAIKLVSHFSTVPAQLAVSSKKMLEDARQYLGLADQKPAAANAKCGWRLGRKVWLGAAC
jgi:hypothetical protein